jgi:spore coat protein U-like protein
VYAGAFSARRRADYCLRDVKGSLGILDYPATCWGTSVKFVGRVVDFATPSISTLWRLALWGLFPVAADASTSTSSINVSATVTATCLIGSAPLAFGDYSGRILDQAAKFTVLCTDGTPYTVSLDNGTGAGANASVREMTGPNNQTLAYSVYSDAARTSAWGSTTGANTVSATGDGVAQSIEAYGRIPAAQSPAPGAYTDVVTVTLTY